MRTFSLLIFSILLVVGCSSEAQKNTEKKPTQKELSKLSTAYFAAGCFWHEEALFESVKGVKEAVSGYAGGFTNDPSYRSIESGNTGHAESVKVYYDPSAISYADLLKVYFTGQDPTQVNGQGPDLGTQYRSIAFYSNDAEKKQIEAYIQKMTASGKYEAPIAAEVAPMKKFWVAEDYHQDYIKHNPNQGYVQAVSIPEIKHFQKQYPGMIKPGHMY